MVAAGILREAVGKEEGGLAQGGINAAEIGRVAGKAEMLEEWGAEACGGSGGGRPERGAPRCGISPSVAEGVRCPAACAVEGCSRGASVSGEALSPRFKGRDQFGQVARLGWPVAHLERAVGAITTVVGRVDGVAPEALGAGRQAAGARGGEQQVAPELVVEGHERGIAAVACEGLEAFIDGPCVARGGTSEAERDAPVTFAIGLHMLPTECCVGAVGGV